VRKPTPEDLKLLRGQPVGWFERWLKLGLQEYLFERQGRYAFPGAEDFIEQGEGDIASDLARIGRALTARDLENFATGVTNLLENLDFSGEHGAVVAIILLKLGAGIGATGISRVIAEKAFTIPDTQTGRQLYEIAFSLADQLADIERADAVACLRHLISLPRLFRINLSGRALVALSKAQPREFPAHFELLRRALDERYGFLPVSLPEEKRRASQRQRLIASLISIIPESTLLAAPCVPNPSQIHEDDNWWAMTLAEHFPELLNQLSNHLVDLPRQDEWDTVVAEPIPPVRGAPKAAFWEYAMALLGRGMAARAGREMEYTL
jgi:hypothetical protein